MSFLDKLIDGAVQIEVAKAENPRTVQTIEQQQVSTGQQVNAEVRPTVGGSVPGNSFVPAILKDKRVLIGFGVLAMGFVAYKALK